MYTVETPTGIEIDRYRRPPATELDHALALAKANLRCFSVVGVYRGS
jgi:hypothetical protein